MFLIILPVRIIDHRMANVYNINPYIATRLHSLVILLKIIPTFITSIIASDNFFKLNNVSCGINKAFKTKSHKNIVFMVRNIGIFVFFKLCLILMFCAFY